MRLNDEEEKKTEKKKNGKPKKSGKQKYEKREKKGFDANKIHNSAFKIKKK